MRVISAFIGIGVVAVLAPRHVGPMFDLLAYASLLFGALSTILYPHCYHTRDKVKSLRSLFILLVVLLVSYITNYLFSSLGFGADVLLSAMGLKLGTLGFATVVLFGGTFALISGLKITEREKVKFLFAIVCAGGVSAAITIVTWATTTGAVYQRYNFIPPLTDSQGLHLYYMTVTVLFGVVLMRNKNMLTKARKVVVLGACALAVFSTTTVMVREGWLISCVVLFYSWYLLAKGSRRSRRIMIGSLGGVLITGVIIFMVQSNLLDDISLDSGGEGGDSALVRLVMIQNTLSLIYDHPVWGVGYGNYALYALQEVQLSSGEAVEVSSPHNALILIAAETGAMGLIAFAFLCFTIVNDARQRLSPKYGPVTRAMAGVLFPFLLVLCLDQFISNSLLLPPPAERRIVQFSYLLWLAFSILVARPTKSLYDGSKPLSQNLIKEIAPKSAVPPPVLGEIKRLT
jgi:hypothetical protein